MEVELRDGYPIKVNGKIVFPLTSIIGNTKETHYYSSELEREEAKREFVKNIIPRMRETAKKYQTPEI